jgi:hypothetical protein
MIAPTLGLRSWVRYRDDIFLIARDPIGAQRLFASIRTILDGVWEVRVEEVSRVALPFLDIWFFKHVANNQCRLFHKPYAKPSRIRIPLVEESSHPASVFSWPCAEVARLRMLSIQHHHFRSAVGDLVFSLCEQGGSIQTLAKVCDASHNPRPGNLAPTSGRLISCVLPFHPVWTTAGFSKVVERVCFEFQSAIAFLQFDFSLKLCWRNVAPTLVRLCRAM